MDRAKLFFHRISFFQYPLIIVAGYFTLSPILYGFELMWEYYNLALVFAGLGISFSTLQDTQKTQNEISKRVWQDPMKARLFIGIISLFTILLLIFGILGLLYFTEGALKELSFGFIVFGISFIGMLKAMLEMFENHRLDKNP